jgi:hypothetical protein
LSSKGLPLGQVRLSGRPPRARAHDSTGISTHRRGDVSKHGKIATLHGCIRATQASSNQLRGRVVLYRLRTPNSSPPVQTIPCEVSVVTSLQDKAKGSMRSLATGEIPNRRMPSLRCLLVEMHGLGRNRDQPLLEGKQDQVCVAPKIERLHDVVLVEFDGLFAQV